MQGGTDKSHQRGKIKSFWLATGISKFLSSLNTFWDESKVTGKSCKRSRKDVFLSVTQKKE